MRRVGHDGALLDAWPIELLSLIPPFEGLAGRAVVDTRVASLPPVVLALHDRLAALVDRGSAHLDERADVFVLGDEERRGTLPEISAGA